jgi:hypothetical protein
MKIKCIYNNFADVPNGSTSGDANYTNDSDFYLDIGREYTVYGMTVKGGLIWYYICDRCFSSFPRWKPASFFRVMDSRLSRYWIYSFKKFDNYPQAYPIITFPEWANEHPDFYDRLTDKDEYEVEVFKSYKELMDLEFPDASISDIAQIGDDEWVICPNCINAWHLSTTRDALIRCPKCSKLLNNP